MFAGQIAASVIAVAFGAQAVRWVAHPPCERGPVADRRDALVDQDELRPPGENRVQVRKPHRDIVGDQEAYALNLRALAAREGEEPRRKAGKNA